MNRRINFTEVGESMADGWGWPSCDETIAEKTNALTHEARVECLLAAIVRRLRRIDYSTPERDLLEKIFGGHAGPGRSNKPHKPDHPVSDALCQIYRRAAGNIEITPDDLKERSVRSVNALESTEIRFFSEIDEDTLQEVRNCGKKTIEEIMAWKNHHIEKVKR